jgi:flagellar motor switch protein FliN/FliY
MADEPVMSQDEIERLLGQTKELTAATAGKGAPSAGAEAATAATVEDASRLLGQEEVEKLLRDAGKTSPPAKAAAAVKAPSPPPLAGEGDITPRDVEFLFNQAEQALESINAASSDDLPQGVVSYRLEEFTGSPPSTENATIDLIRDVELDLKIELGRTNMYLEDVLKLRRGAVVPLDKLAGDPVDIYVNGRLIARGEVLVLNDNFCVRVAELIAGANVA